MEPTTELWPGFSACYSRAYVVLENMRKGGHVTVKYRGRKPVQCSPSQEMRDLIEALNKGDEEKIKHLLWVHRQYWESEKSSTQSVDK